MKKVFNLLLLFVSLFTFSCKKDTSSKLSDSTRSEVLVVSEEDSVGIYQLFIREIDGSNSRQLTFNSQKSSMPAISPDGIHIAYVMEGNGSADIYLIRFDGMDNHKITSSGVNFTPGWSADGSYLFFAYAPTPFGNYQIYSMKPDGTEKALLVKDSCNCFELVPTASPDGRFIAFSSNRSGMGKYEIWSVNTEGSNLTRLTTVGYDSVINATVQQKVPAWSPDGKKIALWKGVEMDELHHDGSIRDAKIIQSWKVWVMNADGSNLKAIDQGDDPAWSNDSKYILHPDPMYSINNNNIQINVNRTEADGFRNTVLFKTGRSFARMAVGYRNK
jgi:Tol biopolymer transport system component